MTETTATERVVAPLCCGWEATVQLNYPRQRSGVFRVVQVVSDDGRGMGLLTVRVLIFPNYRYAQFASPR